MIAQIFDVLHEILNVTIAVNSENGQPRELKPALRPSEIYSQRTGD